MKHRKGKLFVMLSLLCVLCWALPGIAQDQINSKYGYYYKDQLITLNPSERLVAIKEIGIFVDEFIKEKGLKRDPLSERVALKRHNLGLYRLPVLKSKATTQVDLNMSIESILETASQGSQPVFEQGQALFIPYDEVIVGFKEDTTLDQARENLEPYLKEQGIVGFRKHQKNIYILTINNPSKGRVSEVSQFLAQLDKVQFAEPNHIIIILDNPTNQPNQFNGISNIPVGNMTVLSEGEPVSPNQAYSSDLSIASAPTWHTIASMDFESSTFPPSGWSLGWFTGWTEATWGRTSYRAHNGSHSIYCAALGNAGKLPPGPVPTDMAAVLRSPLFDLTSYEEVYVEVWFYAKNDLYPGPGGNLYDYPSVWVFNNDTGAGVGQKLGISASGDCTADPTTENGWRKLLFRVPPSLRVSNAFFDFRYNSDSLDRFEGAYIDDIRIIGTTDVDTEPLGNDIYSARQYELKNVGQIAGLGDDSNDMHVPEAWDLVSVSPDVVVAVIDSGVNLTHPDLNLVTGYNHDGSVGGSPQDSPPVAHGTCCAGNIGAIGNNLIGVMGTAPNVKIMPVYSGYTIEHHASAINVAVAHVADILSNSWGWVGAPSSNIEAAITNALTEGRIVLFAAGNGPDRSPYTYDVVFPGNLTSSTDVICVGASSATDEHKAAASSDGNFWWGSSYVGDGPDVCAPSPWSYTTDIQGALGYNDGSLIDPSDSTSANYTPTFGGTSSSTPKVAGIVALMLSANPNLTPADVKCILRETADDIDVFGIDDKTGAGRVNAYQAVMASMPIVTCPGDFDNDGDVDGSDLAVFAADFGRTDCDTGEECEGDFDEDDDVDGSDLATFAADFGRTDCL